MSHNNKETALVLGGLGLIGGALVEELTKTFDVFVVDKREPKEKTGNVKYYVADALSVSTLEKLVIEHKPRLIVNSINIATIFSDNPEANYKKLVRFYYGLYQIFSRVSHPIHFIQMGTTGSGGLGFDIPFTHGDKIEDLPIINKAAFSGISTAMLTLMSRSFGHRVKVSEVKPGLSIFRKDIVKEKFNGSNLILVDGGESGFYTYNELALLTNYMGFTTVDTIIDKVMKILGGDKSFHNHCVYDTIGSLNGAIIKQNHLDHWRLVKYLNIMKRLSGKDYVIATGKLGPPSITRDLILACLKKENPDLDEESFTKIIKKEPKIVNTIKLIKKNDNILYDYLISELNYNNYLKVTTDEDEPWKNVKSILEKQKLTPIT
jgi:nucleoside-diphosphate-sugar epimerase